MKKFYDSEFHFSPEENELARTVNDVEELADPFYDDCLISKEPKRVIYDEYKQGSGALADDRKDGRRARLKKLMLMQAASVLAIVSVVTAAAGADPLGSNSLFGGGSSVTPSPGGSSIVTPVTPAATEDDTVFPTLGNLNPDFAGDYAWSGTGTANSEEYVRFYSKGDTRYTYLVMGGAWSKMGVYEDDGTFSPNTLGSSPNAVYDKETNTLTLTNFNASVLDMNLMGNGFTVKLEGDNSLDQLVLWGAMYGGSVTFTGDGSLTLGKAGGVNYGLLINGENSQSCVMVKKGVKLDIYGTDGAIIVGDSTMDPAIYISDYLTLTGGEITSVKNERGAYDCTVLGADGNPATHVTVE